MFPDATQIEHLEAAASASSVNNTPNQSSEKRHSVASHLQAHAEHGPLIDHSIPQADAVQASPELLWSRIRSTLKEPFSEFFGVFILILFGDGVVAQVVLSKGTKGDYQSISWGWG
jgi:aquaglyceroporin related protein, other eukaryote